MLSSIFKLFAGRPYKKFLKNCQPIVVRINELEKQYQSLTDEELRGHTQQFRDRLEAGEILDDLLPEAFATVKNAARRLCGQTHDVCGYDLDWNMVHYDVQLIGGIALHNDKIAEMATGEGKTLVSTLPLYLNALPARGAHCVTVNDYLAKRDSEWMGYLYEFLGLTVGCIQNSMPPTNRREQYNADITFGTASEFGFDFLRDNGMAMVKDAQVQREHVFCIVDEVDSVLVDEARTPLIISGPVQITREAPFNEYKPVIERLVREQTRQCNQLIGEAKKALESDDKDRDDYVISMMLYQVKLGMPKNKILSRLMEEGPARKLLEMADLEMHNQMENKKKLFNLKEELYYIIDEKQHQADLTEKGRQLVRPGKDDAFVLPDLPSLFSDLAKDSSLDDRAKEQRKAELEENFEKTSEEIHTISQLLRAYSIYEKDNEYVVQDGKVQIVDENTGRLMPGRRWSDGLHQAVEAKEGVVIEKETKTYATITIQNYFRQYEKLSGMTGTAETEASEFWDIYNIQVMVIPTNEPNVRDDLNDVIYKTRRMKYNAAIKDVQEAHAKGQPVLVGTASVEASEIVGRLLKRANIPHTVLNAKFHEKEAEIIARAGQRGAVTIATNMAGRGTDIKLGEGVAELGGLLVLGTERHESRRIDRQLRGRCARQGDPGVTKFYISLEDTLMRLFAQPGPLASIMDRSFSEEDELAHPLLNRSIESAQKKVEQSNYSQRKRLLQYDDVLNTQRDVIYGTRNEALHDESPKEIIYDMIQEELDARLENDALFGRDEGSGDTDGREGLLRWVNMHFPIAVKSEEIDWSAADVVKGALFSKIKEAYDSKESLNHPDYFRRMERAIVIQALDRHWQDHLTEMEELRRSVGLRSYGQKDPLSEYKREAFKYFEELLDSVRTQIATSLFRSAVMLERNIIESLQERMKRATASQAALPTRPTSAAPAPTQGSGGTPPPAQLNRPGRNMNPSRIEQVKRDMPKVGRNDPCPCGSGKKYKQCCGK